MNRSFRIFPENLGYFPYFWMIYFMIPIYSVFTIHSTTKALIGFSLILFFIYAYRMTYWVKGTKLIFYIFIEIAVIFLFAVYLDPGYIFMGYYPATAIGQIESRKQSIVLIISMITIFFIALLLSDLPFDNYINGGFVPGLIMMAASPYGVRAIRKWRYTLKRLEQAHLEIERLSKQEERQRIARDLHDTLGQTLTMITLKSQLVERLLEKDRQMAYKEIQEIQHASRSALSQLRELISNMHTIDLEEELESAKKLLAAAGIHYEVIGDWKEMYLSLLARTILAISLREIVTNVVKHSNASRCWIEFVMDKESFGLKVRDDGVGFSQEDLFTEKSGHGLYGLRQRLDFVGGTIQWQSERQKGASIMISIPRIVRSREELWKSESADR